jgi:hypothetical protein
MKFEIMRVEVRAIGGSFSVKVFRVRSPGYTLVAHEDVPGFECPGYAVAGHCHRWNTYRVSVAPYFKFFRGTKAQVVFDGEPVILVEDDAIITELEAQGLMVGRLDQWSSE